MNQQPLIKKREIVATQTLYKHKLCAMTKAMAIMLVEEWSITNKPVRIQDLYPKNSTYRKNRHKLKMFGLAEKYEEGWKPTTKCNRFYSGYPIQEEVYIRCTDVVPSEIQGYGGKEITISEVKYNPRHLDAVAEFNRQKRLALSS